MDWDELLGSYQNRTNIKSNRMFPWSSILSGGFGVLGTILQNVFNTRQIEATNKANRELVDVQNQFQREESEKAFQRSLPVQQVNNLRNAGMSQAGAINTLNGGGSYTPAPVNAAQDQTPQVDFSQVINAIQAAASLNEQKRQAAASLNEQKRQFDLQQREAKRQFDAQLDFEKGKWQDEAPFRSENLTAVKFQNEINRQLSEYKDEHGNKHNLLVEGAAAERLADMAEHRLNALKFDLINSALELPGNVLKALIREINSSISDAESFITGIRKGKKTAEEIYDYSQYDRMPTEITQDGKKFKRIKLGEGVYEWREVK